MFQKFNRKGFVVSGLFWAFEAETHKEKFWWKNFYSNAGRCGCHSRELNRFCGHFD